MIELLTLEGSKSGAVVCMSKWLPVMWLRVQVTKSLVSDNFLTSCKKSCTVTFFTLLTAHVTTSLDLSVYFGVKVDCS